MSASDDEKPLGVSAKTPLILKRLLKSELEEMRANFNRAKQATSKSPSAREVIAKMLASEAAAHARIEAAKGPKPDIPADTTKARSNGQCAAIRGARGRWARDKHPSVCGREAVRDGMCKEHYLRDILKVSTSGKSPRFRPFWQYQVPLRDMTDIHHETLGALPVATPYEECIARMNEADPSQSLKPIYAKPS